MTNLRLTRRPLMASIGAADVAGVGFAPGASAAADSPARAFADAAIAALCKHRIVAIGEIHEQAVVLAARESSASPSSPS